MPAFCASDVMLELAPNLGIVFAAGATVALVGRSPQDLLKLSFFDLVSSKDRSLVRRIMKHASTGERIESAIIHLDSSNGESPPLTLGGYHLPDMKGHYFLTLRLNEAKRATNYPTEATGKGKTSLPSAQKFSEQVGKRLFALRESSDDYQLTFLRLGMLAELYQRLPTGARRSLMTGLGRSLRSRSINGRLAGQFSQDCFGIVHTKDGDMGTLVQEIAANAHVLDPDKGGFDIDSATVDLDVTGMSQADTVAAVIYAADHFCTAPAEDFAIETLSTSLYSMAGEVVHRSSELKALVSSANFSMAFQP
ncbi:MAG: PAS domain-containing protein, partial [Alphaproteobacteria bacterium]